jgi:signal transduction histidine kinase
VSAPRLTIRIRLTLLYTGLFLTCGALVITITYALVASLPVGTTTVTDQELEQLQTFAVCMRAHGIDMSDPDTSGGIHISGPLANADRAQLDADPGYKAAYEACKNKLPDPVKKEAFREGALDQRKSTLAHLLQFSMITLAAATLLAALAGWIVAGRALRPVHQITEAARAASEHNLSARVALRGPRDELRELADTFDTMLSRLQTAFDSQQRFVANAGHELRTPLTVMRTTLDVVLAKPAPTRGELRRMGQDVRVAVDHAEQLINALLTLARNERGLTVHEPVDLATVAEDVLDSTDPGDRRLHTSLDPAMTSGEPILLERLIANVVDNATRYNLPGGDLWITTSTMDGHATLVVANTGPVIAQHDLAVLFEPFQRLQGRTTSDGFGLGLAIVASITAVHHGTVTAEPRPGGGLTVTITMPRPD